MHKKLCLIFCLLSFKAHSITKTLYPMDSPKNWVPKEEITGSPKSIVNPLSKNEHPSTKTSIQDLYWTTFGRVQRHNLQHFICYLKDVIQGPFEIVEDLSSEPDPTTDNCLEEEEVCTTQFITSSNIFELDTTLVLRQLTKNKILLPYQSRFNFHVNLPQDIEFNHTYESFKPLLKLIHKTNSLYIDSLYGISEFELSLFPEKINYFKEIASNIKKFLSDNSDRSRKKIVLFTHYPPVIDPDYNYGIINPAELDHFTSKQLGHVIATVLAQFPHNEIIVYSNAISAPTYSSYYIHKQPLSPSGYNYLKNISSCYRQGKVTVYTSNQTFEEDRTYLNEPFLQICTDTFHPLLFKVESKDGIETYVMGEKVS